MTFIEKLRKELEVDEGVMYSVYLDHLGLKTCGIGHLCLEGDPEYSWPPGAPVSEERVAELFEKDINAALVDCRWTVDDFDQLPEEVQLICCNMMFNLGRPRFSGFKKFIAAVHVQDWKTAAKEMADSKWHRQVQNRSGRLITRMLAVESEDES